MVVCTSRIPVPVFPAMNASSTIHPSIQRLIKLSPRSSRAVESCGVPVYFVQVPESVVASVRHPAAAPPPLWPNPSSPDSDQQRTWRLLYENNVTIYIRSNVPPNDPPGIWAVAPNREEIFIPESLLKFEIPSLNPTFPALPAPSISPGPNNIPTLVSRHATTAFSGRRCRLCSGQNIHDPYCPGIQPGYHCEWCKQHNGAHELACPAFASEH